MSSLTKNFALASMGGLSLFLGACATTGSTIGGASLCMVQSERSILMLYREHSSQWDDEQSRRCAAAGAASVLAQSNNPEEQALAVGIYDRASNGQFRELVDSFLAERGLTIDDIRSPCRLEETTTADGVGSMIYRCRGASANTP